MLFPLLFKWQLPSTVFDNFRFATCWTVKTLMSSPVGQPENLSMANSQIMLQLECDRTPDSVSASGKSRGVMVRLKRHLLPAPAGGHRAPYEFGSRCSNFENRIALPPDLLCSRTKSDPDTLAESCRSVARRKDTRQRHVGHRFDFFHFEYPKIGLPLAEPIQRVMIRTEIPRQAVPTDCSLEHTAERYSVNGATVNAKSDDATGELVDHHENPMGSSVADSQNGTDRNSTNCPSYDREM